MIKRHWWKGLGVALLIYIFLVGILVPLNPGIVKVSPAAITTGESVTLEIKAYNSNFSKVEGGIRAWLKLDNERALAAKIVEVRNDVALSAQFEIPEYLPISKKVHDFTLILDNEVDGASVLPSAVFITQDSIDPAMGKELWRNDPITKLHQRTGMTFPFRNILAESIRNTYFHVPLWFAMVFIFLASVIHSGRYLRRFEELSDLKAQSFTKVGILFGLMGLATGAIWAKNTWGEFWSWDVKQNMTAIALLIYLAYFILRGSFEDMEKKARISAVYNLFAFATLIPLIYVIPRMTDSLHPGAGGNPAFGSEDLDNTMRMVFYPAIIGWTLLGFWIANLVYRTERLKQRVLLNLVK